MAPARLTSHGRRQTRPRPPGRPATHPHAPMTTTPSPPALPSDETAEAALLGAALRDPNAIAITAAVEPSDYYRPAHGHIAAAVRALHADGRPVDAVTVAAELDRAGLLDKAVPRTLLMELYNAAGFGSAADSYATIIRDRAASRRALLAFTDLADLARNGHTANQVLDLARQRIDDQLSTSATASTLRWADVAGVLANGTRPTIDADLLTRSDGQALIYSGRVSVFQAEPAAGKSFIALWAALEVLHVGGSVLYIDLEDTDDGLLGRLLALGALPEQLIDRFHLVRPDGPITELERLDLSIHLAESNPELVVIDAVAPAMAAEGVDENDNQEVVRWMKRMPRWIARTSGAAVLIIDHVTKSKEDRGRYARGAGAKLAEIDGAAYELRVLEPFSRSTAGHVAVIVAKDRPGAVGPQGATVAHFHIEPAGGGSVVKVRLEAPTADEAEGKPTSAMQALSEAVGRNEGQSTTQLEKLVKFRRTVVTQALNALETNGFVQSERKGNGRIWWHRRPYPDPDPPADASRHLHVVRPDDPIF